jgi:hypothetical protein
MRRPAVVFVEAHRLKQPGVAIGVAARVQHVRDRSRVPQDVGDPLPADRGAVVIRIGFFEKGRDFVERQLHQRCLLSNPLGRIRLFWIEPDAMTGQAREHRRDGHRAV